jgi:glycosyltransferase involved in cell wall biosynthesis
LLAPAQDVTAFSYAIDRIIGNSQWRDKLGLAGSKRVVEKFSWEGVASQLNTVYTQMLDRVKVTGMR